MKLEEMSLKLQELVLIHLTVSYEAVLTGKQLQVSSQKQLLEGVNQRVRMKLEVEMM